MRVVYLGSPVDAVPALRALVEAGHDVAAVVTQPDRRRGRGGGTQPSPVKAAATELGLPVFTPNKAREIVDDIRALEAEIGVVVAFGQLLPVPFLDAFAGGLVNVHFSLLPRWRGAAPVERAVLAGDVETGVCLMRLEEGLDTGPVWARASITIGDDETAGELHERLVALGTGLLVRELPTLLQRTPEPQSGEPTYAEKLHVDEFRLDPVRPAPELKRLVRAGNPRPGAWFIVNGRRVKVLRAHTVDASPSSSRGAIDADAVLAAGDSALALDEVQPEGKQPMPGRAWRAGVHGDARVDAAS